MNLLATTVPPNEARFTLAELIDVTGGATRSDEAAGPVSGVVLDSRRCHPGCLFVALRGDHQDGHAYVPDALAAGAGAVLVDQDVVAAPPGVSIRVQDTRRALGDLAAWHRRRWGGALVAVAGSAGKTTTRSAIEAVLRALTPGEVHAAVGNLNNDIGLPMVLLGLGPQHHRAVIEIGTNAPGEVARLTTIAAPDVALLTLVALEHCAGLGDLDAIEREEGDALRGLAAATTAIANADCLRAVRQLDLSQAPAKYRYGRAASADHRIDARRLVLEGGQWRQRVSLRLPSGSSFAFRTPLLGEAGALAAAAAVATVDALGLPWPAEVVAEALESTKLREVGRLHPVALPGRGWLIDDAYNASPASVRSSARAAREMADHTGGELVLVIGEMGELGQRSESLHRELGHDLASLGPSRVVGLRGDAAALVRGACAAGLEATFTDEHEEAAEAARAGEGDVVLVKGSRHVGADRVVAALLESDGALA